MKKNIKLYNIEDEAISDLTNMLLVQKIYDNSQQCSLHKPEKLHVNNKNNNNKKLHTIQCLHNYDIRSLIAQNIYDFIEKMHHKNIWGFLSHIKSINKLSDIVLKRSKVCRKEFH